MLDKLWHLFGQNINVLLIKCAINNFLTVLIYRVDSVYDGFHGSRRELFEVPDLLFQLLGLKQSDLILLILDELPIKLEGDLVITEVVEHSKVFIRHLVLNKPGLLHAEQLLHDAVLLLIIDPVGWRFVQVLLSDIDQGLLLLLELSQVMMSPQSSDLEHVFEIREVLENVDQVLVLEAVELAVGAWSRDVMVLVPDLIDEASVTEVGTLFEHKQDVW